MNLSTLRRDSWSVSSPTESEVVMEPTVDTLPTVTGTAATDLINSAAHGLEEGDIVIFTSLTGGTGLTADTPYFIITENLAAGAFQISATRRGAAALFSADLTAATAVGVKCGLNSVDQTEVDDDEVAPQSQVVLSNAA